MARLSFTLARLILALSFRSRRRCRSFFFRFDALFFPFRELFFLDFDPWLSPPPPPPTAGIHPVVFPASDRWTRSASVGAAALERLPSDESR